MEKKTKSKSKQKPEKPEKHTCTKCIKMYKKLEKCTKRNLFRDMGWRMKEQSETMVVENNFVFDNLEKDPLAIENEAKDDQGEIIAETCEVEAEVAESLHEEPATVSNKTPEPTSEKEAKLENAKHNTSQDLEMNTDSSTFSKISTFQPLNRSLEVSDQNDSNTKIDYDESDEEGLEWNVFIKKIQWEKENKKPCKLFEGMADESTSETEATHDKEKRTPSGDEPKPVPKSLPEPIEAPIKDRPAIENDPDDPEGLENQEIDADDFFIGEDETPVTNAETRTPEAIEAPLEIENDPDDPDPEIGYGNGNDQTPVTNAVTRTPPSDKSLPEPMEHLFVIEKSELQRLRKIEKEYLSSKKAKENNPGEKIIAEKTNRSQEKAKLKEWKCPECKKKMKYTMSAVNQHRRIHIEEEKKECNFPGCKYKTNRPNILKQHMKKNHKDVPCKNCRKKFPNRKDLKEHTKVEHTTTTCPVCDKKFHSKSNMTKHNNSVHNKKKLTCKKCKKQYCNNQDLKKHIKKQHDVLMY